MGEWHRCYRHSAPSWYLTLVICLALENKPVRSLARLLSSSVPSRLLCQCLPWLLITRQDVLKLLCEVFSYSMFLREGARQITKVISSYPNWGRCVSGRSALLPVVSQSIVKMIIKHYFRVET